MPKRSANQRSSTERSNKRQHVANGNGSDNDDEDDDDSMETDSLVENSIVERSLPISSLVPRNLGGLGSVAGVIRRISMNNFMCHNHLEIVLGSHVNFVVGRNGSGKSAVVAALVVGLGGKATATSRGSSIKNFIKMGKRTAWIEIVLNNKGKDSYKPDIYGDKIIVKRRFSAEGGSSYAICSEKGQHVSNRHDELARITDHLNIQVDNPVSILNQDTSRNFLNTKSSGDKFKFFMKATQLEQMNQHYDQVRRDKERTKQIITEKEQTLPTMQTEVKEWETKLKNMTAVSELRVKVKHLKHEMAWALVNQVEIGVRPKEKTLRTEENAIPKFIEKVEQSKKNLADWEARHKEVEERLIGCSNDVKDMEPLLQEKKRAVQQAKEKLAPVTAQLRVCDRELSTNKRECKQCEERIEELKTMASHDYESERQKREEQIQDLKAKLAGLMSKQNVTEHELGQYRSAIAKYKTDLAAMDASLKSKDAKIRSVQNTLGTLQSAKHDRLRRFGDWVPAAVEKIKAKAQSFHKLPKGPVGACFQLVDSKWAVAVETCLKALCTSYVCHDHHDEQILLGVFQEVCPRGVRPTIITSRFVTTQHDIRHTRAWSDRYPGLLDVIKCNDPVIINTLIDQRAVERVMLIADDVEARAAMTKKSIRNARECFTIEGDQALCEPTLRYYSQDRPIVRYLMSDIGEQVAALEKELKQLRAERATLEKELKNQQNEISQNQAEEKRCMTQLNKLQQSMSRHRFDISELENVEDPVPVDVTTLEEEVASFQQKITELKERRSGVVQEKETLELEFNTAKENYAQVEATIRDKSDSGVLLREEISQAQKEVDTAKNENKHYTDKLKEQERKIEVLKTEIAKHKKTLEGDTEKALQICPRINTKRAVTSIETEITQIQHQIEKEEQMHGNEQEVMQTYREKKQTFDRIQVEVQQLRVYVNKLDKAMERRHAKYMEMRKDIASRTKYFFIVQLFERSFKGRMQFDFDKQTLDIVVTPNQDSPGPAGGGDRGANVAGQAKDLKCLSGGERSFSTVCFILALWEAMESPFRCLDEFDVFMDMVNRRISMDMMMEAADNHKDMQFIFLTPQDMSNCRKIDNVKIFRMPDPERSQKTLDFTASQDSAIMS